MPSQESGDIVIDTKTDLKH